MFPSKAIPARVIVYLIYGSLAAIFLWFGMLKLLRLSPAEPLIAATFSVLPITPVVVALGLWEIAIGVCFVLSRTRKVAAWLMLLHLPGTFLSYFTATERCFSGPFILTTEGEFVFKNLLLIGVGLLLLSKTSEVHSLPVTQPFGKSP